MKKQIIVALVAVLGLVGCQTKPAEQQAEGQDAQEQMQEPAQELEPIAGNPYLNIVGVTPAGEELSLSSLVGQTDYLLLDFWASWCGPCRRFIPVLKDMYGRMPAGRFNILSCSVDQDVMAWQVALNEEKMPWPQMREDEEHMCSDKYGVQFIPHTVLIDKEGKIVGVNLEEPQIEEILLSE